MNTQAPNDPIPSALRTRSDTGITGDTIFKSLVYGSAGFIILMILCLLYVLVGLSAKSMKTTGLKFLVTTDQNLEGQVHYKKGPDGKILRDDDDAPIVDHVDPPSFGALPVIYGTAVSSILALIFAVPLSLGAALFLIRIARSIRPRLPGGTQLKVDIWASFMIEFLAAIPSIAYGMWALLVLVPFMNTHIDPSLNRFFYWSKILRFLYSESNNSGGSNMLTGGLVLAIMIIPIITAVSRDVLKSVPNALIEGSLALGATWWQSCKEMLRYSRSGLFGAIMLGLARASGETMAVAMVIGNKLEIHASPLMAGQTMSGLLATKYGGAIGLERSILLEVALLLLVMSLVFNMIARTLIVGNKGTKV